MLTPETVASDRFGKRWDSPPFDAFKGVPGRAYASPLYLEDVKLTGGPFEGRVADVVFVGTSNADVYAVSALAVQGHPGRHGALEATPRGPGPRDRRAPRRRARHPGGGCERPAHRGSTSRPTSRLRRPRAETAWRVFALDLGNGNVLPGWPVLLDPSTVVPVNQNGPATFLDASKLSQRGGLAISPDGHLLYVPFGGYFGGSVGWLVAVDTVTPRVASSFSSAPELEGRANGGIWASGGPAVDTDGSVFAVTGNSPPVNLERTWGASVLRWAPGVPLQLTGTYTAWNHCQLDNGDIDLSGSGVTLASRGPRHEHPAARRRRWQAGQRVSPRSGPSSRRARHPPGLQLRSRRSTHLRTARCGTPPRLARTTGAAAPGP